MVVRLRFDVHEDDRNSSPEILENHGFSLKNSSLFNRQRTLHNYIIEGIEVIERQ